MGVTELSTSFRRDGGVDFSEAGAEELEEVGQITHTFAEDLNNLVHVLLDTEEDVNDELIRDVVESL